MTPKDIYEAQRQCRREMRVIAHRQLALEEQYKALTGFVVGTVIKDDHGAEVLLRGMKVYFWENFSELEDGKTKVVPVIALYVSAKLKTRPGEFSKLTSELRRNLDPFEVEDKLGES